MANEYAPNTVFGFSGTTIDDGNTDINGNVKRCRITFTFPQQPTMVSMNISNGENDWGAKMGDGTIIPLINPKVEVITQESAVVIFEMTESYPSNSPCFLVNRSGKGSYVLTPVSGEFQWKPNTLTSYNGITSDGYGTGSENGLVKTAIITISYPVQLSEIIFSISNGYDDWAIRMPDGSTIPVHNPEYIGTSMDNSTVKFEMEKPYPSNTPCVLVNASGRGSISVKPVTSGSGSGIPVTDITMVPTEMISGQTIDLHIAKILPYNATNQDLSWRVVSGPGEISKGYLLHASNGGSINIRAEVVNNSESSVPDYFAKSFVINVTQNIITIDSQPTSSIFLVEGSINIDLAVVTRALTDKLSYQWYINTTNSYSGASAVENGNGMKYHIPSDLTRGDYYYFCEISSDGADTVKSIISHTHVEVDCLGIKISPRTSTIPLQGSADYNIQQYPINAYMPDVTWESSNSDILEIDSNGKVKAKLLTGTVTITAKTVDGRYRDTLNITVDTYIPVSNIGNIRNEIGIGEAYQLSPVVIPSNASYHAIRWYLDSKGSTNAVLNNGTLYATDEGVIKIHAEIDHGFTLRTVYRQDFVIRTMNKKFVPVTNITLANDLSRSYYIDEVEPLQYIISPSNSSMTHAVLSIQSGPGVIISNNLSFTGKGAVVVKCTVANGVSTGKDYTQLFTFSCSGEKTPVNRDETLIPVNDISITFIHEDEKGVVYTDNYYDPYDATTNPMTLPYTISPLFATNQEAQIYVKRIESKQKPDDIINKKTTIIPDSFWTGGWGTESNDIVVYSSGRISCNTMLLKVSTIYRIYLHFYIKDGAGKGVPFEKDVEFKISTENVPKFVPLTDLTMCLPDPLRIYYPILPMTLVFTPENATIRGEFDSSKMILEIENPMDEDTCGVMNYKPSEYDMFHTIPPLKIFEWFRDTVYLYPYNPGKIRLKAIINEATVPDVDNFNPFTPSKTYFLKNFEFDVKPPFVPVKVINGIPASIPSNCGKYYLNWELNTEGGLDCYNPCWDEEVPTYKSTIWSKISGPSNCSITSDGVITVGGTGKLRIQATVPNGTQENLTWYDKSQPSIDYTQQFDIDIVDNTVDGTINIMINTINGDEYQINSLSDFTWLCSNTSDHKVSVQGREFTKGQIKSVEFISSSGITSLRGFAQGCTQLTSIAGELPNVTGEECMDHFLAGCTSFNRPIKIPSTVNGKNCLRYFMQGCTSMNSSITLPPTLTGDGCLHGFLDGCTSFNRPLSIPSTVTGIECMENFLRGCTSFNQPLTLPSGMKGYACLRGALMRCTSFNQPLTLPNDVGEIIDANGNRVGRHLNNMLEKADDMCSTITVPAGTGNHAEVSDRSFSAFSLSASIVHKGILFSGPGASALVSRLRSTHEPDENGYYAYPPWTHIKNLD